MDSLAERSPQPPEVKSPAAGASDRSAPAESGDTERPEEELRLDGASPRKLRQIARQPGRSRPVLEAALPYIGVTDEGTNSGEQVEAWQARLGHGPGTEWCGHFASFSLDKAGALIPTLRTAWATNFAHKIPASIPADELRHAPPPGWLAVNDYESGGGHVDIVRDTTDWPRWIGTIGGNTSGPDCRTCGVFKGRRSMSPESRMSPEYFTPTICTL